MLNFNPEAIRFRVISTIKGHIRVHVGFKDFFCVRFMRICHSGEGWERQITVGDLGGFVYPCLQCVFRESSDFFGMWAGAAASNPSKFSV